MSDFQTIIVLIALAVLYLFKRLVLDKYMYRMKADADFVVASGSLNTIYLQPSVWRKYYSPIWILCSLGLPLGILLTIVLWPTSEGTISGQSSYFLLGVALLVFPFWLWFRRVKGLKFSEIPIDMRREEAFKKLITVASENNWKIINSEQGKFVQAESSFSGISWGELITIVITDKCILVNSITSPFKKASVASFGRNAGNLKKIKVAIGN